MTLLSDNFKAFSRTSEWMTEPENKYSGDIRRIEIITILRKFEHFFVILAFGPELIKRTTLTRNDDYKIEFNCIFTQLLIFMGIGFKIAKKIIKKDRADLPGHNTRFGR